MRKESFIRVVSAVAGVYVLYVLAVGLISSPSSKIYTPEATGGELTDRDKGRMMANAVTFALEQQLDVLFGWLPNDLMLVPAILDNTTSYQRGVIYATRPASDIVAKTVARYGKTDTLDKRLVDATSRYFTYSESVWGFWWIYDCESKYRQGIKDWHNWAESIGTNAKTAGVYNVKSDDVYAILKYCSAMLDYVLGILNNEKMGHFECDNNVYYCKGVVAVVSNVLNGLIAADSSVVERGGKENVREALTRLGYAAEFNPLYVLAGGNTVGDALMPNHVAALARHLDVANNRINDMMQSMEK